MSSSSAFTREQVRLSLLRHLAANPTRYGLTTALLRQFLMAEGTSLPESEIEAELLYLADKRLVAEVAKSVSPEMRAWRATAEGRDHWAMTHGG